MNPEFIAILKKLVTEQGKEVLFNPTKCKAFLADYTHGEFKKESRLLLQTIEIGVPKAIDETDELSQCRKQQIRLLHEEYFLTEEIAEDVIDALFLILIGEKVKTKIEVPNTETKLVSKNKDNLVLEEDIVKRNLEIWICGRCNTINDFKQDSCKKCKKEFNPPLQNFSERRMIKLRPCLWEK